MSKIMLAIVLVIVCSFNLWASNANTVWYTQSKNNEVLLEVSLFLSTECPHCQKADAFFKDLETTLSWIHVKHYYINQDKNALSLFNQFVQNQSLIDFNVPSIFFCNSRWIGFDNTDTTGKELVKALNYCRQQIKHDAGLTPKTEQVLQSQAMAHLYGMYSEKTSSWSFFITVALTDAFNPCALFVLGGFFAFLLITKKNQLLIGIAYLFSLVIMHYLQQSLFTFSFMPALWMRGAAVLVGILGLIIAIGTIKKQKTNLLVLGAVCFALIITAYQQTCLMNWSFIFEKWLERQNVSLIQKGMLQLTYQILYILPLFLTLMLYLLFERKYLMHYNERLTRIGRLFLFGLSLLLVFFPTSLAWFGFSFLALLALIILGYCFNYAKRR